MSLWVFGTGFTLHMKFNFYTTIIIGIPTVFFNMITTIYADIPYVGTVQDNEFTICPEAYLSDENQDRTVCSKLGFYLDDFSELNVFQITYIR